MNRLDIKSIDDLNDFESAYNRFKEAYFKAQKEKEKSERC